MQYPRWILDEVRASKAGLRGCAAAGTSRQLKEHGLHTVCDEALCPNKGKCFSEGEATFLILGDICTRSCAFCAVDKRRPSPPDPGEPGRVAELARKWGLRYAVFTSPTRDDLPDGGAEHFASTIRELYRQNPSIKTEPLVPDFGGDLAALRRVLAASPSVLSHNVETVPELYGRVRAGASYRRSLDLLAASKKLRPGIMTKSGLMLGLGESDRQLSAALRDLASAGCDLLTLGQYLPPSRTHLQVEKYYTPEEFDSWRRKALEFGFKAALCGPLVRSSYRAGALYREAGGAA